MKARALLASAVGVPQWRSYLSPSKAILWVTRSCWSRGVYFSQGYLMAVKKGRWRRAGVKLATWVQLAGHGTGTLREGTDKHEPTLTDPKAHPSSRVAPSDSRQAPALSEPHSSHLETG